jgi:hypothetical protein
VDAAGQLEALGVGQVVVDEVISRERTVISVVSERLRRSFQPGV